MSVDETEPRAETDPRRCRTPEQECEALRRSATVKDKLLATVSHDLRSPLTNIKGYADLLGNEALGPLNADQRGALDVIQRNCTLLLESLTKLSELSRLEAGTLVLNPGQCTLEELAREAVESYAPLARAKKITLACARGADPVSLQCDKKRVLAILGNLLSNGVKFCRSGERVDVSWFREDSEAVLTVADSGPGIPASEQPQIFDRFVRLSNKPTGGEKGAGLGLSISRDIARLHGGELAAASTPEEGSTFTLRLPLEASVSPPAGRAGFG